MTPSEIKADYRRLLSEVGESVSFRHYSGAGTSRTYSDTTVLARVMGYEPDELIGSMQQGDRRLIVLADDLTGITIGNGMTDKFVVRGRECSVEAVDDNTRRVQGILIAYEIRVRG